MVFLLTIEQLHGGLELQAMQGWPWGQGRRRCWVAAGYVCGRTLCWGHRRGEAMCRWTSMAPAVPWTGVCASAWQL